MKILIARDKAGFELKERVKENLQGKGREVEDVGLTDPQGYMTYILRRTTSAGEFRPERRNGAY
jgi:ribose 5-phosphate isomerase RpiB